MLKLPGDYVGQLDKLKAERKFEADAWGLYTGVKDVKERLQAEAVINDTIQRIEKIVDQTPSKSAVLEEFKVGLSQIRLSDTEDRERAASYFEQIMDCIGLESSDGVLNNWMYGFDPP